MKILHLAHDRGAAAQSARALHGIAPQVALTWAQTPAAALQWLDANRDVDAVIVDVHAQPCAPFATQVRDLGLAAPLVVLARTAELEAAVAALNTGVDGYVVASTTIESDLPRVVADAIDRERARRERLTRSVREREARICTALQQQLLDLEGALREAEERNACAAAGFADQLAHRHAEFVAGLAQAAQSRDALGAQLSAATTALDEAQQLRRAEAAAAADRLREREAEFDQARAKAEADKTALQETFASARQSHQQAMQRALAELAAAAEREAGLEERLARASERIESLGADLSAAEAAHRRADRQYADELSAAGAHLDELRALHAAAVDEHERARAAFDRQVAEAAAAHERAEADATAALAAMAAREAEAVERLGIESAARAVLEHDLGALQQDAARARARLLHVASAYRRRAQEQQARFEAQLADIRSQADDERRAQGDRIDGLERERETLRHLLATAEGELKRTQALADEERQAHDRARAVTESELQRVTASYAHLRQSFDSLQTAFQILERVAGENAAERTRLETVVADREGELVAQAERHRLAERTSQDAIAQLQQELHHTRSARDLETARLEQEAAVLRRELDLTRSRADAWQREAERVPDLQAQLDVTQRERRREFERAPYGLCRCTHDGIITDANHSFVAMLGRRRVDEVRNVDFAAAVSECASDVQWLFEQARTMRKTDPLETRWKTKDGRQLIVRLEALAVAPGLVEIVAEDITSRRALEERLAQAQRMEAVGRLASEVAVTCDGLLRDATRGAHEWLASLGADDTWRRQGERLLADMTRASGFLQQLGVYGAQQRRALDGVSAQRTLRDLAPVLKRVVGADVELVLSKSGGSFDVDVEPERLERVLVNVAAYARDRMPRGGQMRIDLATTAVGRRFAARYPNVRPGDHVLITVTELPGGAEASSEPGRLALPSANPGLELATLVDLVGSCGGHLWMEAQPAGNMMIKIHLPKPTVIAARQDDGRSNRGGRLTRWLRSSAAVISA